MAATWHDDLPVRKAVLNKVIHGSHSHFEQWPDVPSLDSAPVASPAAVGGSEPAFDARGVAPPVPGIAPPDDARVAIRYVPFCSAIESKYSVWLPLHRRIV
jgi:hypothetical protein